jgi:uncharacterized Zn finger protein
VAERRRKAEREMQKLKKKGHPVSPVTIEGRTITRTFWGRAWCENLERYSDFSNRLPRGRTYVRNGSVVDLQIAPGEVKARVSGSEIYQVAVKVSAVRKARWTSICTDCAGAIDSLVELLQGRFSKGVMERICQQKTGLFPAPAEIQFSCSCPDWASMCKHVAAVFYGIGARLDDQPELLFRLRQVDEKDLIAEAGSGLPLSKSGPATDKVLDGEALSELFGLEMATPEDDAAAESAASRKKPSGGRRGKTRSASKEKKNTTKTTTTRITSKTSKRRKPSQPKKKPAKTTVRGARASGSASADAAGTPGRKPRSRPERPPSEAEPAPREKTRTPAAKNNPKSASSCRGRSGRRDRELP